MSLRTRMLVGFAIIAAVVVAAVVAVLTLQRNYLIGELDARLGRQVMNASAEVTGGSGPGQRRAGLADLYVGLLTDAGLQTLGTPDQDPGLAPVLDPVPGPGVPTTVPATGGSAEHMRVITTELPTGTLVVGRSLGEVEDTIADLRATLAVVGVILLATVALVFWWMSRLGLDPILRVTRVARAIAGGDTTQRVEPFPAGTEAQDLGSAFNQLVEANEATNARLRQFVADASHELRTPLVTLKGYAALHGSGGMADPEATADAMRRIRQEANRMGRLVENLLLLAEIDRGNPPPREPVDIVATLSDLAEDLRVLDPDREVSLVAPATAVVAGDRDGLTQVLTALTSNALRHTPPGTAIDLRVQPGPASVRIEVADHGPGIAPEDLPRVFDRFYRADAARARASGGSGLGLAIAAAVVRAHGGRIGVQSPPGSGATFWVELPSGATAPASDPSPGTA